MNAVQTLCMCAVLLAKAAIPVATDGSDTGMNAIAAALAGHRIVAAGEASHGAQEFFAFKAALFKYLAEHDGFTILAVEGDERDWSPANQYLHGGSGEPASLLSHQAFTIYRVKEMRDLLLWMRRYNETAAARGRAQLTVAGIDSLTKSQPSMNEHDERLAAHVAALADSSPDAKVFVWAHDGHVALSDTAASGWQTMGARLHARYGTEYYAIGLAFHEGWIRARPAYGANPVAVQIPSTDEDTLGTAFASAGGPFFLNVDALARDSRLAEMLAQPQMMWMPGGIVSPQNPRPFGLTRLVPGKAFDAIVFVPATHAAVPL